VEWLESARILVHSALRVAALATAGVLGILLLLGFDSVFPWSRLIFWIGPLLAAHSLVGLFYRSRVLRSLRALRSMGLEIGVLGQGLKLLQSERFKSPRLQRIVESIALDGGPLAVRRLKRLIHLLSERDKEWFYAVSRTLLIGTQLFLSIEKWKAEHGASLARWLSAWGEFEALMALAGYSHEHPENSYPHFLEDKSTFEGRGLANPLLPISVCIRNEMNLNDKTRFYVISGSNMSGKSTLIRTIGLNAILAYAGAPVCATDLRLSLFSICASLAVVDSLLEGKSKFLAEMDRLRQALDATLETRPVLFLIDEILSGTNSRDRRIAAEAIVRTLIERGAVGVLSTHDLALTEIATLEELGGANVYMGSRDGSDPMDFDHVIKPGVTTESNALAIARLAGVPV
jgi:DNA mismatch repair ATPase MutS